MADDITLSRPCSFGDFTPTHEDQMYADLASALTEIRYSDALCTDERIAVRSVLSTARAALSQCAYLLGKQEPVWASFAETIASKIAKALEEQR